MTSKELEQLIKTICGPVVSDAVRDFGERELAPLRAAQTRSSEFFARVAGSGGGDPAPVVRPEDKGLDFACCIRATAAAKFRGTGADGAIEILKQWGKIDLAEKWADARQKALAAGDATAGGFLVPTQFSQDVIEFLRARAVVRSLNARTIPVPTGTIKIPKLTGGATAYYIGENTAATKSEPTTGQLTLTFKKLVTLVPLSNDLIRYASPGADAIVRDDTVNAMRVREDQAFIRDTGTDSTPKGLRYWAHADNIVAANGTASVQNTFTDLGKLWQKLLEANIPMIAPGWIMSPRVQTFLMTLLNSNGYPVFRDEMSSGRLWGFPYGVTTNVPTNLDASLAGNNNESEVYLADFAQAVIGESMNLVIDTSAEASYTEGGTVVSAYDRDQTVVRAIAEHDFGLRHDKGIAVLTQVKWAPGSV